MALNEFCIVNRTRILFSLTSQLINKSTKVSFSNIYHYFCIEIH